MLTTWLLVELTSVSPDWATRGWKSEAMLALALLILVDVAESGRMLGGGEATESRRMAATESLKSGEASDVMGGEGMRARGAGSSDDTG